MHKIDYNLQEQIEIRNATQRTVSVVGGKGTGKTTLIKMMMMDMNPCVVFDPLNVVAGKAIDAIKFVIKTKDIDDERLKLLLKAVNQTLSKKKNVILSFDNMVQPEEISIANYILPKLNIKDGFVIFDEIHEFSPLHSGSTEVERFVRHCRNKNIGVVLTTQRPASVHKNVLALTDYLILFRVTWAHDLQAVKDLLKDILDREEVNKILTTLPRLGFMEGYAIDYRSQEVE